MPSTFTNNGGIELPADGEKDGVWGDVVNLNMQIVDRLTNGVGAVSLTGTTHTLTTANGVLSDGQYALVVFGGFPTGTNTVTLAPNDAEKIYFVRNATAQDVVMTQGSGGDATIPAGAGAIVYANGAGTGAAVSDLTATFVPDLTKAGVTASIDELNILDGVTADTAELNILDGANTNITTLTLPASTTISAYGATLVDDADATAARTTLGLGTMATQASSAVSITGGTIAGINDLSLADGGTGASTAAGAVTNLGLDPLLAAKAPLASPALTGTPTAPTATAGTNTTQVATTAFVQANSAVETSGSYVPTVTPQVLSSGTGIVYAATNSTLFWSRFQNLVTLQGSLYFDTINGVVSGVSSFVTLPVMPFVKAGNSFSNQRLFVSFQNGSGYTPIPCSLSSTVPDGRMALTIDPNDLTLGAVLHFGFTYRAAV